MYRHGKENWVTDFMKRRPEVSVDTIETYLHNLYAVQPFFCTACRAILLITAERQYSCCRMTYQHIRCKLRSMCCGRPRCGKRIFGFCYRKASGGRMPKKLCSICRKWKRWVGSAATLRMILTICSRRSWARSCQTTPPKPGSFAAPYRYGHAGCRTRCAPHGANAGFFAQQGHRSPAARHQRPARLGEHDVRSLAWPLGPSLAPQPVDDRPDPDRRFSHPRDHPRAVTARCRHHYRSHLASFFIWVPHFSSHQLRAGNQGEIDPVQAANAGISANDWARRNGMIPQAGLSILRLALAPAHHFGFARSPQDAAAIPEKS